MLRSVEKYVLDKTVYKSVFGCEVNDVAAVCEPVNVSDNHKRRNNGEKGDGQLFREFFS